MGVSRLNIFAGGAAISMAVGSCTTSQVSPLPEIPANPPEFVRVPHPEGVDMGDLMAIFTEKNAPPPESYQGCDGEFQKLRKLTQSKDELEQGARELIQHDPVKYHWCFYSKIMLMERALKESSYIDERQKIVLEAYTFLTPASRAFLAVFHDSRYLRWAVARYRKLSEYVFYRKVELTPEATQDLMEAVSPFGNVRPDSQSPRGVMDKYGLTQPAVDDPSAAGGKSSYPPSATETPQVGATAPATETATAAAAAEPAPEATEAPPTDVNPETATATPASDPAAAASAGGPLRAPGVVSASSPMDAGDAPAAERAPAGAPPTAGASAAMPVAPTPVLPEVPATAPAQP